MTHTTPPPLLQVTSLTKRYTADGPLVVNDVSLSLAPGEILSLVGPSGCGKTTTLRLIAGFEHADRGRIQLGSRVLSNNTPPTKPVHIPPHRRSVGVVFQDYALFPHLTVLDNVLYGVKASGRTQRTAVAMQQLDMLGLAEFARRMPHTLSGGQQQRVALARTIAAKPDLVLLDEPFSNLDVTLRESARRDVRQTLINQGVAAILVTHDREEAMVMGNRVAVMNQGRILQTGHARNVYHHPVNRFVAAFLGSFVELDAIAQGTYATSPLGTVQLPKPMQGPVRIALRPEQIIITHPADNTPDQRPQGVIDHCEFAGQHQTLHIRIDGRTLPIPTTSRTSLPPPGSPVHLHVQGEASIFND